MISEMILYFALSIFVCRSMLSAYDKNVGKGRYITIQNSWLAKLLIPQTNAQSRKKVPKRDRNKLPIYGLIGYLLNALALLICGLSAVAPTRPSSPYVFESEDWPTQLDTGNQKVAYVAVFFSFCWVAASMAVWMISWVRKDDMHIALKWFLLIFAGLFALFSISAGVGLSLDILLSI